MIVACLASGPSLTVDDVDYLRHRAAVLAVNDNYRIAPWCRWIYAADYDWWRSVPVGGSEPNFVATMHWGRRRYTCCADAAREFGLTHVLREPGEGLGRTRLRLGSNSGYQAINLACLLGARKIVLLGYDMGATGATHWFGSHPDIVKRRGSAEWRESLERTDSNRLRDWAVELEPLARDLAIAGVAVVNCTRQTAITCFPRMELQQALP